MRVLLVNPFQVDLVHKRGRIYNRRWTPLDLANTAAVLEQEGIETAIVDANAEQLGPRQGALGASIRFSLPPRVWTVGSAPTSTLIPS